jgi:hypothetical protein
VLGAAGEGASEAVAERSGDVATQLRVGQRRGCQEQRPGRAEPFDFIAERVERPGAVNDSLGRRGTDRWLLEKPKWAEILYRPICIIAPIFRRGEDG